MGSLIDRLSIRGALTAILVLFAVLLAAMGSLGYISGVKGQEFVMEIDRVAVRQVDLVNNANIERLKLMSSADAFLEAQRANSFPSETDRDVKLQQLRINARKARELYDAFREVPDDAPEKALIDDLAATFGPKLDVLDQQLQALEAGDVAGYLSHVERQESLNDAYEGALRSYQIHAGEKMDELIDAYDSMHETFSLIGMALLGVALVTLVAVRFGLQRLLVRPLSEAVGHLQRLAKADLSEPVRVTSQNEVGQLLIAMREMHGSLSQIVAGVREGSGSILVGAQQIAGGNADLSARTEQQAASLEETAASMEQLTATVKHSADSARQASSLASEASTAAGQGREVVGQVVATMQDITASSQQISSIISVIDSIAFQTNILALNASVEAARAGEQGRGFAVVAGEVRNLAGRCADAAREIKGLIEASTGRVREGAEQVERAGKTIGEVVVAVRRVTDIIDEISSAAQEQSAGIAQINTAISQLDQVTQQNAALVQQASAASASLADQAHGLERSVEVFRLAGEQQRPSAPRREPAELRRPALQGADVPHKRTASAAVEDEWETF